MKEVWKNIPGFEGKYLASNLGRVKSLPRNGTIKEERVLALCRSKRYDAIGLRKNGEKQRYPLHRIIAKTFVPNPLGLPQVDHIDGNSHNNCANNLRWVTARENCNNPITLKRHNDKMLELRRNEHCKPIQQIDKAGNVIAAYISIREAARVTGLNKTNISTAARHKKVWVSDHYATVQTAGGYYWKFVNK